MFGSVLGFPFRAPLVFYPVVNHRVKHEGARKGKSRTEPNLIQEAEEQRSDNGLDDILADQHMGMQLLHAQMDALEFLESEQEVEEESLEVRCARMNETGSDEEQGDDSDADSYGKEEPEQAPYRVLWFSIFGLGLWLKLGSPSVCPDYDPTGKNP